MRQHLVAAVILALASPALADGTHAHKPKNRTAAPSDAAYDASMATMMSGMDVRPSGDADRDFVRMMLPHHQGAIDMAKVELQYGKDPVLRKLAEDIVKAQETEIATMKAWRDPKAR